MKRILSVGACLILMIFPLFSQCKGSKKDLFNIRDFNVFDNKGNALIGLLSKITDIESKFGKPLKKTDTSQVQSIESAFDYIAFVYPQITISHPRLRPEVYLIEIDGSGFKTARDITIGSTRKNVLDCYGEEYLVPTEGDWLAYYLIVKDGEISSDQDRSNFDPFTAMMYSIAFSFSNDKVDKILYYIVLDV